MPRRGNDARARESRGALADEAFDRYLGWRNDCVAVEEAYARWSTAPAAEGMLAFAAYGAALDQEESAAVLYAGALDRFMSVFSSELQAAPSKSEARP